MIALGVHGTTALLNTNSGNTPRRYAIVTVHTQIAHNPNLVKALVRRTLISGMKTLFETAEGLGSGRALEMAVWDVVLAVGRELHTALLALLCCKAASREAEPGARYRFDDDYILGVTTTFGRIHVPLFAWREEGRTKCPARAEVFPLHPQCRSSELCLEWEARLGSWMPFRQAEEAMSVFTHGAAPVEDTTIARHTAAVGSLVDESWMFRSKDDIRTTLLKRATRDRRTKRPLVYVSCDAHALRRYTDETWSASWKMINGLRVWAVDRATGATIHLGGTYTWGDCREVAASLRKIVDDGYLPRDGVYARGDKGQSVRVQYVFIADGMPWIREHLYPEMPVGTEFILDFYHAMQHVAKYASARFGKGSADGERWFERTREELLGKRRYRRKRSTLRRGHKKRTGRRRQKTTAHESDYPHGATEALARRLLDEEVPTDFEATHTDFVRYLLDNADRMNFPTYRAREMQVGSGAMESLHRIASQGRTKLAGARWLPETALAVIKLRMMLLAGRWNQFWGRPGIAQEVARALASPASEEAT